MASLRCISCLSIFALVIACALVIAGIVGIIIGPRILQNQINNQLPLNVDSDQLDSWSTPPVPIYLQFWLWECVNPADVLLGTKPMLVQRGPFTYLEHRTKAGFYFNENYTVTYRQRISYTFVPNMSLDEELPITMINTPLVTLVSLIRNQKNFTQEIIDIIILFFNEPLFVKHTAREWIWGYEDPILKVIKKFVTDFDDNFGYFYGQNGTDDGLYTVYTGKIKS
jgi:hypothetical protein